MDNRAGEMFAFVTVVQRGGFSAAARVLGLSPSTISKSIARLEHRLGIQLAIRSTRSLRLTAEGQSFYLRALSLLQEMERLESETRERSGEISGLLRISSNVPFAIHVLTPIVADFLATYPSMVVDLSFSDEPIDLIFEKTDLAIRSGELSDSALIAQRLLSSPRHVVAAPAYLERHGRPTDPRDLEAHNCLGISVRRSYSHWPFRLEDGEILRLEVRGNLIVNNGEALRSFALRSVGLARLAAFHVQADLESGRLVPLLESFNPGDLEPFSAIYAPQVNGPRRIQAFIDFVRARLREASHSPGGTRRPSRMPEGL